MFSRTVAFELCRAFKSKCFLAAVVISFFLAGGSAFVSLRNAVSITEMIQGGSSQIVKWLGTSATGAYVSWIGIGAMDISPFKFLSCLLMPILVLIPYSWSLSNDLASGYANLVCGSVSHRCYIWGKVIACGLSGLSVYLANRLGSFIALVCLLPAYNPRPEDVIYIGVYASDPYAWLLYNIPFAYIVLSLLIEGTMMFFWAAVVCLLGRYIRKTSSLLLSATVAVILLEQINDVVFRSVGRLGFKFGLIGILDHIGDFCLRNGPAIASVILFLVISTIVLAFVVERDDFACSS